MYDYQTYDFSELPGTAERIAAFLDERGIKGERMNPEGCPISRYLTANVARPSEDWTGWLVCGSLAAYSLTEDGKVELPMHPQAVRDFIGDFDNYKYPNLIEVS